MGSPALVLYQTVPPAGTTVSVWVLGSVLMRAAVFALGLKAPVPGQTIWASRK